MRAEQNLTGTEETKAENLVSDDAKMDQMTNPNQNNTGDVEHHRVSVLDETVVVKHINDSAITKDHESFSLVASSLNDENFMNRPAVDTREHIINMFDASKMDNSSLSRSRQNALGMI